MTLVTVPSWTGSPIGVNVYAYPLSNTYPIAQWTTHRVLLSNQEGSRPIQLDDTKGFYWGLFEGDSQPANKTLSVATVSLEETEGGGSVPFPSGLTVAVPSILQNAGYDPYNLVRHRGTTWVITITGLGVLDNISQLWFTLRKRESDVESKSLVQISLTQGLLIVNGAPASTASNGSITISDDTNGDVVILVKPAETINFPVMSNLHYDLKVLRTSGSVELIHYSNKFSIGKDVTRKISNA